MGGRVNETIIKTIYGLRSKQVSKVTQTDSRHEKNRFLFISQTLLRIFWLVLKAIRNRTAAHRQHVREAHVESFRRKKV